ncbi:hypothetical protein DIURU_004338 [Diutina rugosa]|uniref:Uncharacterized protein n=1 Tax=Diutina rugosa TaxID=5481 RepID=A0A642UHU5_DIURU|nr:uncharacterized protein DIURU_004338 [Diutina rugosa]KAA8899316.1 hypothetical protein DIURU_004338 [Diutina rugosa]
MSRVSRQDTSRKRGRITFNGPSQPKRQRRLRSHDPAKSAPPASFLDGVEVIDLCDSSSPSPESSEDENSSDEASSASPFESRSRDHQQQANDESIASKTDTEDNNDSVEIIEIEDFPSGGEDVSSRAEPSGVDTPQDPAHCELVSTGSDTIVQADDDARDQVSDISSDEYTGSDATEPKVNVMKHAETGLLVCAEGHEPMVVLRQQIGYHLQSKHKGNCSEEFLDKLRKELRKSNITKLPLRVKTRLPGIPVTEAFYCFTCCKVLRARVVHTVNSPTCKGSKRVTVRSQQCFDRGSVILGSIPGEPLDHDHVDSDDSDSETEVQIEKHKETGLFVCAHDHDPVVVLPQNISKHMGHSHKYGCSEELRAKIRRVLRRCTVMEVPPNITTRLPFIPIVTVHFCFHCREIFKKRHFHEKTNPQCKGSKSVPVKCQFSALKNGVILGPIPNEEDINMCDHALTGQNSENYSVYTSDESNGGALTKVNVFLHEETGLRVCAESHSPRVVLPRQITSHISNFHTDNQNGSNEIRKRLREELLKCPVTDVPPNIQTALPAIPIDEANYCFKCRKVFVNTYMHDKRPQCKGGERVLVKCQFYNKAKSVIIGSMPDVPSDLADGDVDHIDDGEANGNDGPDVDVQKHSETGLFVCAHGHAPVVVLPSQVLVHLTNNHTTRHNCSKEERAQISKILNTCTVTEIPANIQTEFPAIPIVIADYCLNCKMVFKTKTSHVKNDECVLVRVRCQFYAKGLGVVIGPLPQTPDDNEVIDSDESDVEEELKIEKHQETGLLVCAEGHKPRVVLPSQAKYHVRYDHSIKRGWSKGLQEKMIELLSACLVNVVPSNVQTPLPFIPVVQSEYCFNCCRVLKYSSDHDEENECLGSKRVLVNCQFYLQNKALIIGPTPEEPNDVVNNISRSGSVHFNDSDDNDDYEDEPPLNISTHLETGLLVCAHDHEPVLVLPQNIASHLSQLHPKSQCSERLRQRIRRFIRRCTVSEVPATIQTALPAIPMSVAEYCLQCKLLFKSSNTHQKTKAEGCEVVRVKCQYYNRYQAVMVGDITDQTDVNELPVLYESDVEAEVLTELHEETGLFMCAHGHEPVVVLPRQARQHTVRWHSDERGGSKELRIKLRRVLERCKATEVPANIYTKFPAIPVTKAEYCFGCCEVIGDWPHHVKESCKRIPRAQVDCQIYQYRKGVIIGDVPETPPYYKDIDSGDSTSDASNDEGHNRPDDSSTPIEGEDEEDDGLELNIMKHQETGILVCAHGHKPMVVLPSQLTYHLSKRHSYMYNSTDKSRARIRRIFSTCTATEVPPRISTKLPLIPVISAEYCCNCCRVIKNDPDHDWTNECKDSKRVMVDCQFYTKTEAVVVGPLPVESD